MRNLSINRNIVRTKIPKYLQGFQKIPLKKKCQPYLPSPRSLVELAGEVVDKLPLPACWKWSVEDVGHWVEITMKFPQYKECFTKNLINGRSLLLIDASALPKLNICNFEHIQHITAGVRKLYGSTLEQFSCSISRPPHKPETHYLLYRLQHDATRMELFCKMHLVAEQKPALDHWDLIQTFRSELPGKVLWGRLIAAAD